MYLPRLFKEWLQLTGYALAFTAILWFGMQSIFHLRLLNVQTASMTPTFRPGDALIMQKTDARKLRPGMIVSYRSSHNPNELMTHRLIHVSHTAFQTKGDALQAADPSARNSLLVGRAVGVVPGLGKPLGWLVTWPGLVICIYLPAGSLLLTEVMKLERHYKQRSRYYLHKAQVV